MGLPHTEQGALGQGFPRCWELWAAPLSDRKPGCLPGRRVDKHPGANTSLHPLFHRTEPLRGCPTGQRKRGGFPKPGGLSGPLLPAQTPAAHRDGPLLKPVLDLAVQLATCALTEAFVHHQWTT